MPILHIDASYIKHGVGGGASGFSQYLNRENKDNASQLHRYLDLEMLGEKDDLVAHGSASLPEWTHGDARVFWKAADTYERKDYVVARCLEVSLPREMSREAQRDLADDIREVTVGKFTHSWAMHESEATDGSGKNPHIHILFTARREDRELYRTPAQWFAKAADHDKDPQTGGVRKDRAWEKKGHLYDVRAAIAMLTNAAFAREGLRFAVDARNLRAQGIERQPMRFYNKFSKEQITEARMERQALHDSGALADEQSATYTRWQQHAATLPSLDRAYLVDRCTYHVWRYDHSPSRLVEREAAMRRMDVVIAHAKQTRHSVAHRASMHLRRGHDENNARGHMLAPDLSHAREKVEGLSW